MRGFTLIEILIVLAIIAVVALVAIPKVDRDIKSAREAAALSDVQTIQTAEAQYYAMYGRYATSLAELGPPASGEAGPSAADILPKVLADGKKDSCIFSIRMTPAGYEVSVDKAAR